MAFYLIKLESPPSKDALYNVWLNMAQRFWRKFFKNILNNIKIAIISPWRRTWLFIWTNLNPLHPRMLYAMFGWIWPSGSREEDFKIFLIWFYIIAIIFPWRRAWPCIWTNWIPYTQGCFVPSLVEIGSVVLKNKSKIGKRFQTDGRTDRQTDDGKQAISKSIYFFLPHLSSGELKR